MALIPGLTDDLARECMIRVPFQSFRSMLSVSQSWKSEIRSPDFHRKRRLSGHTRPVFVIPQTSASYPNSEITTAATYTVTVFDPENGSYSRLPPGPDLPFTNMLYCRAAGIGSKVFVFIAGFIDDDAANLGVHVYDILTGQWGNGAVMPGPGRVYFGFASDPISEKMLVVGGLCKKDTAMRSTWLYDVASDTWEALGDMENGRCLCEVIFRGGRFHVFHGLGQSQGRCLSAESLDSDTWQWGPHAEGGDLVDSDPGSVQVLMGNGEGDVYGFYNGKSRQALEVRRDGGWRTVAELPVEFVSVVGLIGVMMWRGKLLAVGFPLHGHHPRGSAFVLDLERCDWTQMLLPQYMDSENMVFGCGMDL